MSREEAKPAIIASASAFCAPITLRLASAVATPAVGLGEARPGRGLGGLGRLEPLGGGDVVPGEVAVAREVGARLGEPACGGVDPGARLGDAGLGRGGLGVMRATAACCAASCASASARASR